METLASSKIKVYVNEEFVKILLSGSFTVSTSGDTTLGTISGSYRPQNAISQMADGYNKITVNAGGTVVYSKIVNSTTTVSLSREFVYPKAS